MAPGVGGKAANELVDVVPGVHPDAAGLLAAVEHAMVLRELQEAHRVLRILVLLLDVHLEGRAVHKIEMPQLLVAIGLAALQDLRTGHRIREGVVGDEVVELFTLPLLDLIHESADLFLQALAVSSELLVVHAVPAVRGVGAHGLANRDVVVQFEDLEGRVVVWLRHWVFLHLAGVDGVTLHAGHGVEGLVEGGVEDAASGRKLALPLPVVRADVEHHHILLITLISDRCTLVVEVEDRDEASCPDEWPDNLGRTRPHFGCGAGAGGGCA
mmetsp:Transcript_50045/g.143887  ORF Transcript_50045/g.143887 Transcript_50045/m.143887 type:complete len:270 (+) Transcript_50045:542-1351(+)